MEILDLTKSEVDNVFRLINLANHTNLDSTLYTLSYPDLYVDPEHINNTKIRITAKREAKQTGVVDLVYRRLAFKDVVKQQSPISYNGTSPIGVLKASWAIYNGIMDSALISNSAIPSINDVGNGNSFKITYQTKPEDLEHPFPDRVLVIMQPEMAIMLHRSLGAVTEGIMEPSAVPVVERQVQKVPEMPAVLLVAAKQPGKFLVM